MESTVLSVGKSVLNGALGYAQSAAAEEVALQLGIQSDHAFIRDELEMMQAFLMAAHDEKDENKVVKTWVKQVRDVAYDVEDCLQVFAVRLEKASCWCNPLTLLERRRVAKQMKELRARVEDVSQRNVRYRLATGSGSKPVNVATALPSITGETMHGIGIREARRQKVDLVQLIKEDDKNLKVIAVWGTGGVLGQTSIIKVAYENAEVKGSFECRAWVRVMHPFNPRELLLNMVRQFSTSSFEAAGKEQDTTDTLVDVLVATDKMGLADLAYEFRRHVNMKSCLIVLNDLSNIEDWNWIKTYVPNNKNGSRIIVSTEQGEIANLCMGQERLISELEQPSADHAIFAFYEESSQDAQDSTKTRYASNTKTTGTNNSASTSEILGDESKSVDGNNEIFKKKIDLDEQYPELAQEAKPILKKCNGLPLAIVTMGGFLANQPKAVVEWRKLNEHISAELEMNPELETIRTVLLKSYDGLPYYLKSCFLYLSIFPEDYNISRRRLVRRWTAEGYSREVRGKSAEEIADTYYMELISRSMILPAERSRMAGKGIDSCQLHDLMREISISKSKEENLVFRLEEGCSFNTQGAIRHLAIGSNWEGDQSDFESIVDLSRIRSLTVFRKWRPFFISEKMRLLRVLDLENASGLHDHHLGQIWKLVHLKYLSLRGRSDICHLPNSLGNLRQLQTLDIRGTAIIKLPTGITNLRKLQCIRAGSRPDIEDRSYEEFIQYMLQKMPKLVWNKPCLFTMAPILFSVACFAPQLMERFSDDDAGDWNRHDVCTSICCFLFPVIAMHLGDISGVAMPRGIRKLKALHTLGVVNMARGKAILQDIRRLTRLRKLGVTGINKENSQEFCSAIASLSRLESLSVRSAGEPGLCGCLDGMSSPPKNLRSLNLYGNLIKLPGWINELQNLVKLKLWSSRILDLGATIHVLGKLRNLAVLRLWRKSFQGEELHLNFSREAFPSLTVLDLSLMDNLQSVNFEQGAALRLEVLQFYAWPSETSTGLFSGLQWLPSLKEFMLDNDEYKDEFVEDLRTQLAKNPKQPVLKRW